MVGWSRTAMREQLGIALAPLDDDPLDRPPDKRAWEPWSPKVAQVSFLRELQALAATQLAIVEVTLGTLLFGCLMGQGRGAAASDGALGDADAEQCPVNRCDPTAPVTSIVVAMPVACPLDHARIAALAGARRHVALVVNGSAWPMPIGGEPAGSQS